MREESSFCIGCDKMNYRYNSLKVVVKFPRGIDFTMPIQYVWCLGFRALQGLIGFRVYDRGFRAWIPHVSCSQLSASMKLSCRKG
jgi:hypothetical protein